MLKLSALKMAEVSPRATFRRTSSSVSFPMAITVGTPSARRMAVTPSSSCSLDVIPSVMKTKANSAWRRERRDPCCNATIQGVRPFSKQRQVSDLSSLYLWNHHVVDGVDDGAAQGGGGIHVVHPGQRVADDREVVREQELHPLVGGAAVLQQSDAGVPLVRAAAGQVDPPGHVLDELLGPAVVLQAHPLRAVQHEDHVDGPANTVGHSRF